ncbi:MAG: DUF4352 domain-containing protein [Pseudolysinimonas sp.]|uniref:DUF4352 domain-containing protein n=1 Tax=Pseudolysinimonas sp. TaxID=2680009 RepID=UPI003266B3C3
MVALGLGILGFLLAIFLITAGLAWMLLIPAIALAIVGLIQPKRRRGVAIAALTVGVIGLLLSFVGFRLPAGTGAGTEVLNNDGVNPFSVFTGPLPGQTVGGNPVTGGGTPVTGTNADGLTVTVSSVDCHAPLASVTGLNITGNVCAVTLTATNNGNDLVTIDSSNITANADGANLLASVDLGEGPVLSAELNPGDSTTGLIYVNVPNGTGLDGLSVNAGNTGGDLLNLNLGGLTNGG